MKILELSPFSAGICGVWTRVLGEAERLAKNHEVHVFSSNIERGTGKNKIVKPYEVINKVKITRFPAKASFGQNTFFWGFTEEALKLKPDIIITHAYRQYYSTKALKIAKRLGVPCFLVTHAPFLDKKLRNWKLNSAVFLYDKLIGKRILNQYTKIIAITKWEIPYLLNLGCKKDKIIYIPNGIPEEFFKQKKEKEQNKILFLGRIAPIKDIETLIKAFSLMVDKKIKLEIVGPAEKDYLNELKALSTRLNLKQRIIFSKPIYDLKEKIKKIDSARIFVLSSKREGMPQSLIEAMARQKIVVSSKSDGGKEIIKGGQNGYLFTIGNAQELAEKIDISLSRNQKEIKKEAKKSVEQFSWDKLIKKIENYILNDVKV